MGLNRKSVIQVTLPQPALSISHRSSSIPLFEEVLELLGGFGKFQLLILVLLLILEIPVAFVTFIPIFISGQYSVEWTCSDEIIGVDVDICSCNETLGVNSTTNFETIIVEWSLVCDKAWIADFTTSIQMVGLFFGGLYGGVFADWYGRRLGFLLTTLILALGSAVSAVAPNPIIFALARILCGAGIQAFINITCMAVIEFMPPKWRSLSNSIGPTGEGIMILSALAYLIRPWRILVWATAAPFALIIFIYPFVPESPRWLLRNGRVEEAELVIKYMAKVNGCQPVDIQILERISEQERIETEKRIGNKRYGYLDLFKDPQLRKTVFTMMAIWFSWSFTYYGISYNIKNVKGNIYLNVFLIGLANSVGQRAALLINDRLGRRKSLFASMTFCAVFLVVLAICSIFMENGSQSLTIVTVTFCVLALFGLSSARSSARLLSGESFPTPVRTMGLGLGAITANMAGVITPQLAFIGSRWPSVPFFTFAVISVGGSLVCFLMSETVGKPLSDAITNTKSQVPTIPVSENQSQIPTR